MRNPFRSVAPHGVSLAGRWGWPTLLLLSTLLSGIVLSGCSQAPQAAASEETTTPAATPAVGTAAPPVTSTTTQAEPVATGEDWTLVIMHTNDVMGQVLPCG
ncbi:MAG: hypothetical protein ACYC4R_14290 [Anaerolineae bacterium]